MEILAVLTNPELWIAFFTLTALELVLGIDHIIFISILVDRLPSATRNRARTLGLFLAMFMRVALLLLLSWIVGLTEPLFSLLGHPVSPRDLILMGGGVFLLWKSTQAVHQLLEGEEGGEAKMVEATLSVMIAAVVASVRLMMGFAKSIGQFVSDYPSIRMVALSFLLVVGVTLVADSFGHHVPKGYIYLAIAFSLSVEMLNLRLRKSRAARCISMDRAERRREIGFLLRSTS